MKTEHPGHTLTVQGFARVKIVNSDGSLHGDSGWVGPNKITETGMRDFLARVLIASAGSQLIQSAQLGTGGEPTTDSVRLAGSIADSGSGSYEAVSKSTFTAANAATARYYGTFASSQSFITDTDGYNISNIGLYSASTSDASLACGQTYASSDCQSNQDVQFTYELRIASA
jgi:hypothetical protein